MHRRAYAISCVCVYVTKYWLFSILPVKKMSRKILMLFPFTFRRRECDSQLPVHSRLSITHVYLLMLVCPLWVARSWGSDVRCVGRWDKLKSCNRGLMLALMLQYWTPVEHFPLTVLSEQRVLCYVQATVGDAWWLACTNWICPTCLVISCNVTSTFAMCFGFQLLMKFQTNLITITV